MLVKILFRILKLVYPHERWVILNYHDYEGKGHFELYGHSGLRKLLTELLEEK